MLTTLRYWRLNVRLWLDDNTIPLSILGALLLLLGLAQLGRTFLPTQPGPVVLVATATPALQLLPTPATASGLPRAVTAYAAPDGAVLGAIEPGRPYHIVARAGSEWLQLSVQDSGLVWVRWAESGLVPAGELADLTPPPASTPIVVYVETRPQVVYVEPLPPQRLPDEPASGAAAVENASIAEAAHRAAGDVFTTTSVSERRQAGTAQCTNEGRSCLGRKP